MSPLARAFGSVILLRSMAERAKATITKFDGAHAIMVSRSQAVTDVILEAIAAVS